MNGTGYDVQVLRERMLAHLGGKTDAYPSQLEKRFPHILERLAAVWGHPEAETYLNSLLMTDRADRVEFPGDVASELFRLMMIHGTLQSAKTQGEGGWMSVDDSKVDVSLNRRSCR
jgi:hypothetical protein